jgi:hypothetical protein
MRPGSQRLHPKRPETALATGCFAAWMRESGEPEGFTEI